ncbi:MAG: hypothetical protein KF708_24060 [Pirellulales bacterium]|nr:hypothetical protein [Pirellulales bacterium]
MSVPSSRRTATAATPTLEIHSWPIRDEGLRGWSPLAVGLLLSILLATSSVGIGAGIVAFILLAIASWRSWVPVRFFLDTRGLRFCLGRRERLLPWPLVAGYRVERHGVTIFPATKGNTGIDALRGIYVPFGDQQDALLALLDDFKGPPVVD